MTDYSAMTDAEINERVAKSIHDNIISIAKGENSSIWVQTKTGSKYIPHVSDNVDYCNNPSDMWPLIVENKINIEWVDNVMPDLFGWASANALSDSHEWISHLVDTKVQSPLRAACIVYLMMRECDEN